MKNIKAVQSGSTNGPELELLLAVSADLVTVRDADDLLRVVTARLKNLIGFTRTHICTIDDGGDTFSSFIAEPAPEGMDLSNTPGLKMRVNDGFADKSAASAQPVCFDLRPLKDAGALPFYYQLVFDNGIRQIVISRLTKADKVFGFWFILFSHSDPVDQNSLQLIQGISHQISSAVSNIISNQEIKRREEEKTRILEFSDAIASVRDKDVLAKLVHQHLWNIFGMVDYCIWLNSREKDHRIAYLYDKDTPIARSALFQQGLQMFSSTDDYLFQQALNSDEVFFLEEKDWASPDQPGFAYGIYGREFHVKGFGASRLRLADEDLAVIVFSHNNIKEIGQRLPLYRSICSQLAIVLSNLLATEKVHEQLEEINRYKDQLEVEKNYLQEEINTGHNASDMIGSSLAMRGTFALIDKVAASGSTVLITGETGTGKELVARAIHLNSPRKNKLMVKVNCAALPANLIESELFGHEKGSFTGAYDRRIGKFELADKGTLFLDEIGEMPFDLQAKLLRALQEKEIERIGSKSSVKVDVRFIAATNRDLEKEVREGRFREDLYYRLNIFPIAIPALRDRSDDIPALAEFFTAKFARLAGKKIKGVSKAAMKEMLSYHWPGNIRELEHLIERSVLLATGDTIANVALKAVAKPVIESNRPEFKMQTIDDSERELILRTLEYCDGQISGPYGAAKLLGVPRTTLHSKIKKLKIVKKHGRA